MRKSTVILGAGTIVAGSIFLIFLDAAPKPQLQPDLSPGTNHDRQRIQQPATNSPEAQPPESQGTQQDYGEKSGEAVMAIATPPEFDQISADEIYWHPDLWRQLHGKLEREPVDPAWSNSAETEIRNAVNQSPEISRHGIPTISCRTTLCEAQMVVYGASDMDEGKWSAYFAPVLKKLRADFEFKEFSIAQENGKTVMVLYLSKLEQAHSVQ